jgi:hypothetical protein
MLEEVIKQRQGRERDNQTNVNRSITRGYSREEWQNLSQAQRNNVYHARERYETVKL